MVNIARLIGKGYKAFWEFKGRYRMVIGGRGSKKSCTTSIYFIYMIMKMPLANLLVIRRFFNTHRDSTYSQLKWAIYKLGVQHLWKFTQQPLEMTYIPTGQKILFKGMDDAQSLTSITVDKGYLCWVWFEEFYQVTNEDEFNKIDMSIRGEMPEGYFKQLTLTMNPWSENHFSKKRFFDVGITHTDPNFFATTTNYMCNEFLGDDDRALFEWMREHNPKRYSVEGLGNWGRCEGLVYSNFAELDFDPDELKRKIDNYGKKRYIQICGMDFGYSNDPTAIITSLVDEKNMEIYVYDESYMYHATNNEIADEIRKKHLDTQLIYADSEDPRTINELHLLGLNRIVGCKKGKDSIISGIQKLQDYRIFVHPRCPNILIEFNNYAWDTDPDTGKQINKPIDEYNHACFSGDTVVKTLNGNKKIKDITTKDFIYSYDLENKKVQLMPCIDFAKTKSNADLVCLKLSNGDEIKVTPNHKVLTQRGYVSCSELTEDDSVYILTSCIDTLRYLCYNGIDYIIGGVKCITQKVKKYFMWMD